MVSMRVCGIASHRKPLSQRVFSSSSDNVSACFFFATQLHQPVTASFQYNSDALKCKPYTRTLQPWALGRINHVDFTDSVILRRRGWTKLQPDNILIYSMPVNIALWHYAMLTVNSKLPPYRQTTYNTLLCCTEEDCFFQDLYHPYAVEIRWTSEDNLRMAFLTPPQ